MTFLSLSFTHSLYPILQYTFTHNKELNISLDKRFAFFFFYSFMFISYRFKCWWKKTKKQKNIFMKMEKKMKIANSHICKLNGKSWWKVTKRNEMEIVYLTYFNNFFAFTFLFLFFLLLLYCMCRDFFFRTKI